MKIGDNILFWQGINAGSGLLFTKKNIIIVDAQMRKDQAELMVELMELYGLNLKNVKYIVNTHRDLDHMGGNAWLQKLVGGKIVAHVDEVKTIENPEQAALAQTRFMAARNEPFGTCKVEVVVTKDTVLDAGDLTVNLIHTPGHTSGSICVYHEGSKALFSGDTVLGWGKPYSVPLLRMDSEVMLASLERLNRLDIKWILPGHGDVVQGGNERIDKFIAELKALPNKVLELLRKRPCTSAEVSEELVIWPQTAETILKELEKKGKIRKTEKQVSTVSVSWTVA
jgi:glyoxylase-like metal-dependent hydrolase (beta-lactamase superfamily II)